MRRVAATLGFAFAALVLALVVIAIALGFDMRGVELARPGFLALIVLPFFALGLRAWLAPRAATLRFSRVGSLRRLRSTFASKLVYLPDGLRFAAVVLLAFVLAKPESTRGSERTTHQGIDIVVVLDLSVSMETPDMAPNRLGAAQVVIDQFITRRRRDRIGLVGFGSQASTVSPLTVDHGVLRAMVRRLRLGQIDGKETAIGAGLGVALNRLEESNADTQIVVLLTDGVHNADGIDPDTVSKEAADRGIKIYTILMGQHQRGADGSVDPARLERIASMTGGYAYLAADQKALQGSFQDLLDKLEKSTIESRRSNPQLFGLFLWPALLLLLLDVVLRSTRLRRFP